MNPNQIRSQTGLKPRFILGLMVSILALSSCAQANKAKQIAPASAPAPLAAAEGLEMANSAPEQTTPEPKKQSQLIKRAQLTLIVQSIHQTTESITEIIKKQQGDILKFEAQKSPDNSQRQTAYLEFRVPQQRLETTLNALAKLGTVENQMITAEDVSDQLVDVQARLRNLRKSEEMILKIMERAGSVGDVLKAANELSTIRESIERIDAQLRNLQNQVAYSTINLRIESLVSVTPAPDNLGLRVQETWGKATHRMGEFTWLLVGLVLWLLAFSPYLLIVGGGIYGYRWYRHNRMK
ncbi:conserved exported hypothetical protein [Planktothrix sp. PCC 11201]|uniref:DUF4349 domain-containing protein n=1 Tax=Planktothrix sp. PCC 11201 TaxID=1729650 RepID=UPI0009143D1C|nr:DUF4349 domain-containing protein [Planktothrix sp. PCC 11201]SKB11652.1 conserved exported hypothetical protein [Planktothrix sp. PCC 11201]